MIIKTQIKLFTSEIMLLNLLSTTRWKSETELKKKHPNGNWFYISLDLERFGLIESKLVMKNNDFNTTEIFFRKLTEKKLAKLNVDVIKNDNQN